MIPRIKNFIPPQDSFPYNPSKRVKIPANDKISFELEGRGANSFGITRIIPGGANLSSIKADLVLNNEYHILKDAHLSTIKQLFKSKSLLAPYIIQQNNTLEVTLYNPTGNAESVNIQLNGLDTPALNKLVGEYESKGLKMPVPMFLYASDEIDAGAIGQSVDIKTKSVDLNLVRMAVGTSNDVDISLSLKSFNESIKNEVYVDQINDEYESDYSSPPIKVGKNTPFSLLVSNDNLGSARQLSFIGETYVDV